METKETWNVERQGRVAIVRFTRPPRNFISFRDTESLEKVLAEIAGDTKSTAVLLASETPGYFMAGADPDDVVAFTRGEPMSGDPGSFARALAAMEALPQPVIAAVNGQAWGGGLEFLLACTLRVAARSAHFSAPEIKVGIIPGGGGTQRLPRLIGPGRAARLILSGEVIPAEEALALGLVEQLLPDEGFSEKALAFAANIARWPRATLAAAKRAIAEGSQLPLEEGLARESALFAGILPDPEARGLMRAALARLKATADDEPMPI